MTAPWLPGVKSRNRSSWPRIAATFALERLAVEQVPLRRAARRVADHPGPAADERDRAPAEALEAQEPEDRDQVADVERVGGRVETDVAGDRATGRQAVRQPRRRLLEDPPPAQLVEQAGRARGAALGRLRHRLARRVVSTRREASFRSFTPPMLSCGHSCRPLSRGASAIVERSSDSREDGQDSTIGRIVVVVLVVLLLTTGLAAGTGVVFAVGAYNHYAAGLPDPAEALTNIDFEQQTIIYDRTGKVELARLGDLKRELVTFDQLPGEIIDATTAIEDKDFWINPGFDPAGIVSAGLDTVSGRPRGASTITQQLVRARLLPPEAFEGSTYERKVREIIQSIRLTQAFPGEEGKKTIITAYLNQNFYGNQSYGVKAAAKSYFGKSLADLTLAQDAILAAIPQSPTKFDLMRNADEVCLDERRRGRGMHQLQARRPARLGDRPAPEQGPRPDEDAQHADRHQAHGRPSTRPPRTSRSSSSPPVAAQWKAPHFVWQVRRALGEILCPDNPIDCPEVDTGGYQGHHHARLEDAEDRREVGLRRGPGAERQEPVGRSCASRKIPGAARSWILGLRGHNIHNAAAGVIDYRTGEVLAYVGVGELHVQGQQEVPAPVRRPGRRLAPARVRRSSRSTTPSASTTRP